MFFIFNALKCVSVDNQECKIRPELLNVNSNKPSFYRNSIKLNKCSSSCKTLMIHMLNYVFLMLLKT